MELVSHSNPAFAPEIAVHKYAESQSGGQIAQMAERVSVNSH
jgi:hypothetical protein